MRFDMNEAWRIASAMIRANRQVLLILAGVFFFLPSFAMALLAPMPEVTESMSGDDYLNLVSTYYGESSGLFILVGIAQAVGVLALLALLSDRRPTVGEALQTGAKSLLPYVAAQLLLGLCFGAGAMLAMGVAAVSGSPGMAMTLILLMLPAFFYVATKMSLTAPVMVIDGIRNPIRALGRSWTLTRGNSLRLFGFYALVFIAFMVVLMIASLISGIVVALLLGQGQGQGAQAANGVVSGVVGAVMVVYFVAIVAAAHRQLSGPSADNLADTFS